jgi:hypothetical protein
MVIASRDLTDEPHVFIACSEYMKTLVSALAAGGAGNVEAVEVRSQKILESKYNADDTAGPSAAR